MGNFLPDLCLRSRRIRTLRCQYVLYPGRYLASLNPAYVAKAEEAYGITAEQIATLTPLHSLANFIPVTLGNMLGGMIFVGLPLYLIYKKNWENK